MWNEIFSSSQVCSQGFSSKKLLVSYHCTMHAIDLVSYHRVASDMTIKIGDFGLARQLYSKDYYKLRHRAKVPIKWMPLESIHDGVFNEKTDVVCCIKNRCNWL